MRVAHKFHMAAIRQRNGTSMRQVHTTHLLSCFLLRISYFLLGRYTWVAWPKKISADSINVSDSVGCG
jgi:hypothetical protein